MKKPNDPSSAEASEGTQGGNVSATVATYWQQKASELEQQREERERINKQAGEEHEEFHRQQGYNREQCEALASMVKGEQALAKDDMTVTGYVPPPNFRQLGKVCGFTDLANAYEQVCTQRDDHARGEKEYCAAFDEARNKIINLRHDYAIVSTERNTLRTQRNDLLAALKRIAFEPQGEATASHAEVLRAVEGIARAAIAKAGGRAE